MEKRGRLAAAEALLRSEASHGIHIAQKRGLEQICGPVHGHTRSPEGGRSSVWERHLTCNQEMQSGELSDMLKQRPDKERGI